MKFNFLHDSIFSGGSLTWWALQPHSLRVSVPNRLAAEHTGVATCGLRVSVRSSLSILASVKNSENGSGKDIRFFRAHSRRSSRSSSVLHSAKNAAALRARETFNSQVPTLKILKNFTNVNFRNLSLEPGGWTEFKTKRRPSFEPGLAQNPPPPGHL